jgi:hypothetical protein
LLKDLDDHDAVRTLQTKASVLSNDLAFGMLGNDLVAITRRSCKDIKHDVLDSVGQSEELFRRAPSLDIDTHQGHTASLLCKDIMSSHASGVNWKLFSWS